MKSLADEEAYDDSLKMNDDTISRLRTERTEPEERTNYETKSTSWRSENTDNSSSVLPFNKINLKIKTTSKKDFRI